MKTINVSEDALNTIKRMAVEREQQIEALREAVRAIRDIALWETDEKKHAEVLRHLCNQALAE